MQGRPGGDAEDGGVGVREEGEEVVEHAAEG